LGEGLEEPLLDEGGIRCPCRKPRIAECRSLVLGLGLGTRVQSERPSPKSERLSPWPHHHFATFGELEWRFRPVIQIRLAAIASGRQRPHPAVPREIRQEKDSPFSAACTERTRVTWFRIRRQTGGSRFPDSNLPRFDFLRSPAGRSGASRGGRPIPFAVCRQVTETIGSAILGKATSIMPRMAFMGVAQFVDSCWPRTGPWPRWRLRRQTWLQAAHPLPACVR